MNTLLAAIASVSLLVGGIGIMNIMLVSVTERTGEIGLRMALGARRYDILLQFLVESSVLSAAGGLVGLTAGLAVALGIDHYGEVTVAIDGALAAVAVLFSAIFGVIFGFYPAFKASRLQPADALRRL